MPEETILADIVVGSAGPDGTEWYLRFADHDLGLSPLG
jgi:hypothetical protein